MSLSLIIYKKYLNQFQFAVSYSNETISDDEQQTIFYVWHDKFKTEEEKKKRKMERTSWKKISPEISCNCGLLETESKMLTFFYIAGTKI